MGLLNGGLLNTTRSLLFQGLTVDKDDPLLPQVINLIEDGDFEDAAYWGTGGGWTVDDAGSAVAKHDSLTGGSTHLTKAGSLVLGQTLRVTLDVASSVGGTGFGVRCGSGNGATVDLRTTSGIHVFEQTVLTNTTFYIYCNTNTTAVFNSVLVELI